LVKNVNRYPVKGEVLRVKAIEELSGGGFDTYLVGVESTVDVILVVHYGGGVSLTVIDFTSSHGIYAGAFRNVCELRDRVKHDDKYYYFNVLTPSEVYIRKDQLEDVLRKIDKHFFDCST